MQPKYCANQSFIFQPSTQQTYTYYQFLFIPHIQLDLLIYTQPNFFSIEDPHSLIQQTQSSLNVAYNKQDRNYYSQYFQLLNPDLFDQPFTIRKFYSQLIHSNIIQLHLLYYYAKKHQQFQIAQGLIYGADFMLYDNNSESHQHSQYLVYFVQEDQTWQQIFLKVRLTNEVNKKAIFVKISGQLDKLKQNLKLDLSTIQDHIQQWEKEYQVSINKEQFITNFH